MDSDMKDTIERDLRVLGEQFMIRVELPGWTGSRRATTSEELLMFQQLPSVEKLHEIEVFARSLTTEFYRGCCAAPNGPSWQEIRCIISDTVFYAQQLNCGEAESMQLPRCASWSMSVTGAALVGRGSSRRGLQDAIVGASTVMLEVVRRLVRGSGEGDGGEQFVASC